MFRTFILFSSISMMEVFITAIFLMLQICFWTTDASGICFTDDECFRDEALCVQVSDWNCACLPQSTDQIPCNNNIYKKTGKHSFGPEWAPDYEAERVLKSGGGREDVQKNFEKKIRNTLESEETRLARVGNVFGLSLAAFIICGILLPVVCFLACCLAVCVIVYYLYSRRYYASEERESDLYA